MVSTCASAVREGVRALRAAESMRSKGSEGGAGSESAWRAPLKSLREAIGEGESQRAAFEELADGKGTIERIARGACDAVAARAPSGKGQARDCVEVHVGVADDALHLLEWLSAHEGRDGLSAVKMRYSLTKAIVQRKMWVHASRQLQALMASLCDERRASTSTSTLMRMYLRDPRPIDEAGGGTGSGAASVVVGSAICALMVAAETSSPSSSTVALECALVLSNRLHPYIQQMPERDQKKYAESVARHLHRLSLSLAQPEKAHAMRAASPQALSLLITETALWYTLLGETQTAVTVATRVLPKYDVDVALGVLALVGSVVADHRRLASAGGRTRGAADGDIVNVILCSAVRRLASCSDEESLRRAQKTLDAVLSPTHHQPAPRQGKGKGKSRKHSENAMSEGCMSRLGAVLHCSVELRRMALRAGGSKRGASSGGQMLGGHIERMDGVLGSVAEFGDESSIGLALEALRHTIAESAPGILDAKADAKSSLAFVGDGTQVATLVRAIELLPKCCLAHLGASCGGGEGAIVTSMLIRSAISGLVMALRLRHVFGIGPPQSGAGAIEAVSTMVAISRHDIASEKDMLRWAAALGGSLASNHEAHGEFESAIGALSLSWTMHRVRLSQLPSEAPRIADELVASTGALCEAFRKAGRPHEDVVDAVVNSAVLLLGQASRDRARARRGIETLVSKALAIRRDEVGAEVRRPSPLFAGQPAQSSFIASDDGNMASTASVMLALMMTELDVRFLSLKASSSGCGSDDIAAVEASSPSCSDPFVDALCFAVEHLSQLDDTVAAHISLAHCLLLASAAVHLHGIGCETFSQFLEDEDDDPPEGRARTVGVCAPPALSARLAASGAAILESSVRSTAVRADDADEGTCLSSVAICARLQTVAISLEVGADGEWIQAQASSLGALLGQYESDALKRDGEVANGANDRAHMCACSLGVAFLYHIHGFYDERRALASATLELLQSVRDSLDESASLLDWLCASTILLLSMNAEDGDPLPSLEFRHPLMQRCAEIFFAPDGVAGDRIIALIGDLDTGAVGNAAGEGAANVRRTRAALHAVLGIVLRREARSVSECLMHASEALRLSGQSSDGEVLHDADDLRFGASHAIFRPVLRWQQVWCRAMGLLLKCDVCIDCGMTRDASKLAKEVVVLSHSSSSRLLLREGKWRLSLAQLACGDVDEALETIRRQDSITSNFGERPVGELLAARERLTLALAVLVKGGDEGVDPYSELLEVRQMCAGFIPDRIPARGEETMRRLCDTDNSEEARAIFLEATLGLVTLVWGENDAGSGRSTAQELLHEVAECVGTRPDMSDRCSLAGAKVVAVRYAISARRGQEGDDSFSRSSLLAELTEALRSSLPKPKLRAMIASLLARCHRECWQESSDLEQYDAAAYMNIHAVGVSFDVQQAAALREKLRIIRKRGSRCHGAAADGGASEDIGAALQTSIDTLSAVAPPGRDRHESQLRIRECCASLPTDLAVVSIDLDVDVDPLQLRPAHVAHGVVVTRLARDRRPLWNKFDMRITLPTSKQCARRTDADSEAVDDVGGADGGARGDASLVDFFEIIEDSGASMKGELIKAADDDPRARREWWNERLSLDERLSACMSSMQKAWFGCLRVLLMPPPKDESLREHWWRSALLMARDLRSNLGPSTAFGVFAGDEELIASWLEVLINGASELRVQEMTDAVCRMLGVDSASECDPHQRAIIDDISEKISAAHKSGMSHVNESDTGGGTDAGPAPARGKRSTSRAAGNACVTGARRSTRRKKSVDDGDGGAGSGSSSSREALSMTCPTSRRGALMLVLGEAGRLFRIPFESLPILRPLNVSRMPSLPSALSLLSLRRHLQPRDPPSTPSSDAITIDAKQAYYLLNPGSDLKHTQSVFEPMFTSDPLNWSGDAGKAPQCAEIVRKLVGKELFVYMGHGAGEMYLSPRALMMMMMITEGASRSVTVVSDADDNGGGAAVSASRDPISGLRDICVLSNLLMGCSSGALTSAGNHLGDSPSGTVLSYIMSGSPMTCANLWDVTDKDIDRFSETLLQQWCATNRDRTSSDHVSGKMSALSLSSGGPTSTPQPAACMGSTVASSRRACRLPYLNGAAPVCYGVPTCVSL